MSGTVKYTITENTKMGKLGNWYCKNNSEKFPILEHWTIDCDVCGKKGRHAQFPIPACSAQNFWFVTFHKTILKEHRVQPKKPEYLEIPDRTIMYRRWFGDRITIGFDEVKRAWKTERSADVCTQTWPMSEYSICSSCNSEMHKYWNGKI